MTPDPAVTEELDNRRVRKELSMIQYALSSKQILVPSMGTTGKVFSQHLTILRDLKHKTDLLKQAYFQQMDQRRTWAQVDQILLLLENASNFLDFPMDQYLDQYKAIETKDGELITTQDLSDLKKLKEMNMQKHKQVKKMQADKKANQVVEMDDFEN